MIIRLLFVLAGILLALASCKRSDESTSTGLTRRISVFEGYACRGGTVTRFDFKGSEVFVFADSCGWSDAGYPVSDIHGTDVCFIGGFGGQTDCQGSNFDRYATNPVVVYKKF